MGMRVLTKIDIEVWCGWVCKRETHKLTKDKKNKWMPVGNICS